MKKKFTVELKEFAIRLKICWLGRPGGRLPGSGCSGSLKTLKEKERGQVQVDSGQPNDALAQHAGTQGTT